LVIGLDCAAPAGLAPLLDDAGEDELPDDELPDDAGFSI